MRIQNLILSLVCWMFCSVPLLISSDESTSSAMDASGNIWAAFTTEVLGYKVVKVAYLPVNGEWGQEVILSDPNLDADRPIITLNAEGDGFVVWSSSNYNSDFRALFTCALRQGNTWSAPTQLSTNTENVLGGYHIGLLSSQTAAVVWNSYLDTGEYTFNACQGSLTSGWGIPQRFSQ